MPWRLLTSPTSNAPSAHSGCSIFLHLLAFPNLGTSHLLWPFPQTFSTQTPHSHKVRQLVSQLVSYHSIYLFTPLGFHFKFTFSGRASQATSSKIATPQQPPSKQTHFFPFHGFSLLMQLITWKLCFLYLPLLYPLLERKLHGGYFGFFLFPSNPQGLEKCWTQSHAPLQIFFFND